LSITCPGKAIDRHACLAVGSLRRGKAGRTQIALFALVTNLLESVGRVGCGEDLQWSALSTVSRVMSIEDLETAVSHLSVVEFARFREWFEEFAADQWDRQIEADIRSGRFDAAGKRADEDFEAGRCTPL
jgi:hypothetical protein